MIRPHLSRDNVFRLSMNLSKADYLVKFGEKLKAVKL